MALLYELTMLFIIWSFIKPFFVNKYTIAALVVVVLFLGAEWDGYSRASRKCHEAQLRAQIEQMQFDISTAKKAEADASSRSKVLDDQNAQLQDTVTKYADLLSKVPEPQRCGLDDRDVEWLSRVK